MAVKQTTRKENIERRTFLRGEFFGKFIGYLDTKKSDLVHENFFSIEILTGEVETTEENITQWSLGEPAEFQPVEKFLTELPDALSCTVRYQNGNLEHFTINLNDPKLTDYVLTNQVYDESKVYGDIKGKISGFLKHYDEVEVIVEEGSLTRKRKPRRTRTRTQTGRFEEDGSYKRYEYYYSDRTTYWDNWEFQPSTAKGPSVRSVISAIFQVLIWIVILVPLIIAGWRAIWPFLAIMAFYWLLGTLPYLVSFIWKWFMHLSALAFIVLFIVSMISTVTNEGVLRKRERPKRTIVSDDAVVKQPIPKVADSIIRHFRNWNDYDGIAYRGNIEIRRSDMNLSSEFRNSLDVADGASPYNDLVSRVFYFDRNRTSLVYRMLDSLRLANNLDRIDFAKVVVSFVQDIPYTLILDGPCDASLYNSTFITKYLGDGGQCRSFTKFGILSPVEFLGSLDGDCDTRVLLLFAILSHYNYDVVMLGSELYSHSVLGVNLPISGISKLIEGKRYVIWETTQQQEPGIFPRELSEMRFWNVNLISNNESI